MTPAEAGIQANYWTPKYARPENITQRSHFAPISGEGVPENIFDVIHRQKDLKVRKRQLHCRHFDQLANAIRN